MIKPGAGLGLVNVESGPPSIVAGPVFKDQALAPVFVPGRPNPGSPENVSTQILGKRPYNGATGPMSESQQQLAR